MTVAEEVFRYVTVPAAAYEQPCRCGEHVYLVDRSTLHVDEGDGGAMVSLNCPDGRYSTSHSWAVTDEEFLATFEYNFGEAAEHYADDDPDGFDG
jgi:hypothetical protein